MSKKNLKSIGLKNFWVWIREIRTWAWDGFWSAFPYLVLMFILYGVYCYEGSITGYKARDRLIGLCFIRLDWTKEPSVFSEIFGFVLVARQLGDIRALFGKPSIVSRIADYVKSFPSRHLKKFSLEAQFNAEAMTTSRLRIRVKPGPNATLERRVELLENAVENVEEELGKVGLDLGSVRSESQQSLEELRQETTKEVGNNRRLIDNAVVGGLLLEWVGIIYFLIGTVLATIAPELSALLGYVGQCG